MQASLLLALLYRLHNNQQKCYTKQLFICTGFLFIFFSLLSVEFLIHFDDRLSTFGCLLPTPTHNNAGQEGYDDHADHSFDTKHVPGSFHCALRHKSRYSFNGWVFLHPHEYTLIQTVRHVMSPFPTKEIRCRDIFICWFGSSFWFRTQSTMPCILY